MTRADAVAASLVGVAATAICFQALDWGFAAEVAVVGGDRMLRGELPYRDFWTIYAPGSPALVAALFRAFGRELAVVHAASAGLAAAASVAWFALMRRAALPRAAAAAAAIVFAAAVWTPSPDLHTYVVPRLLLIVAFERVLAAVAAQRTAPLAAAGLALGIAALFKHDVAGYAAVACGLALVLARAALGVRIELVRGVALLGGCALAVVGPAAIAVGAIGGADAWNDLIAFPLGDFRVVRGERYPALLPDASALRAFAGDPGNPRRAARALQALGETGGAHAPELALAAVAVALGALVLRARARAAREALAGERDGRAALAALALCACGLPFFWSAAHVQQNTHIFSMAMLAGLGLAGLWRVAPALASAPRARLAARTVVGALAAAQATASLLPSAFDLGRMLAERPTSRALGVPGTGSARVSAADFAALRPVVDFVRANVAPDEPVYVGLARHDAIVIGKPSLYFLVDRPVATRYHELHPGVSDRADVQREMISDLEREGVRCVVRWNFGWPDARLDAILAARRRALPALGAGLLDAYLDTHFERVARHGELDVLWRTGAARPWEAAAGAGASAD
ncbi:MAG: hypothetical protein R3E88_16645 [Myxococcota bacterium]